MINEKDEAASFGKRNCLNVESVAGDLVDVLEQEIKHSVETPLEGLRNLLMDFFAKAAFAAQSDGTLSS